MKEYKDLLKYVLENGTVQKDRTGNGTISVTGYQLRFNLNENKLPLVTTKKVYFHAIITELLWFLKGDTNIHYLVKNKVNIWNQWANENGDLGKIYSACWRRWTIKTKETVIVKIKKGPAKGIVNIPIQDNTLIESDFINCDTIDGLNIFNENKGVPFNIIKKLGTLEGKNNIFLIQYIGTSNIRQVSRPEFISNNYIKDVYFPEIHGVACVGKPRKYSQSRKEYDLWYNMIARCYNVKDPNYHYYGGKGIYVSPRWLCFENFLNDLSRVPYYEEWILNSNNYNLDKDYYGSDCYDITTVVFLEKEYNQALSTNTRAIEATSPKNKKYLFSMRNDLIDFLNVSDETYRNFENKKHIGNNCKLHGWQFKNFISEEGYLPRRKIVIDQIADLIFNLKNNPFSRRHIVTGWDPDLLPSENIAPSENVNLGKQALPPCHTLFQFFVKPLSIVDLSKKHGIYNENKILRVLEEELKSLNVNTYKLSCHLYQRSGDCGLGIPFNIASYSILIMIVAQCVGMEPGDFIHTIGDAHIYLDQIEGIKKQLERDPFPLPTILINKEITNIDNFEIDDFKLQNYQFHEAIKFKVAV